MNGKIVSVGQGPAGAPAGSHCPDILVRPNGAQGPLVGQNVSSVAQELGDLKYGGGQAAPKYNTHGVPVRTINGVTNSANTNPRLTQMAAPQKPPVSGTVSLSGATKVGLGTKIVKGLGVFGALTGSFVGGLQVGAGFNQTVEGKTSEGMITMVEGSANLTLTIGTTAAVKTKLVTMSSGFGVGTATAGAGLLAAGGIMLAAEEVRRTLRGEKTAAFKATEFYSDLFVEGEKQGGVKGALKQAAGWAGGFFSTLIAVGQGY